MSDALTVTCNCGKQLQVPFSALETRSKCPHCGNTFTPSEKIKKTQAAEYARRQFEQRKYHQGHLENIPDTKTFICPNPKCNFQGRCLPVTTRGYWVPAMVLLMSIGGFGAYFLVGVGEAISGDWPPIANLAGMVGLVVGGVGVLAALTVFVTRVAIAATTRWYCPNCGTRLR